jgi:hypothetical protein
MDKINFNGWPNCLRLSNTLVDLVVTTDVGPRIMRYGFLDEENELGERVDQQGETGGDEWRVYGGHRLWHAPEKESRTYSPDNQPVRYEDHEEFVRLIQAVELKTGIQKELDIQLSAATSHARITHRLRNTNLWEIRLAPWAITVMAQGGTAILPLPPRGSHDENLAPVNSMSLWAYTDLSDPRWIWGRQYIMLRQDPLIKVPQKIGASVPSGWAAYARRGHLFIKKFAHNPTAKYVDFGDTVELFANDWCLEVETLGPLAKLAPGQAIEHIEDWYLFRDVPTPHNDTQVERHVLTRLLETGI